VALKSQFLLKRKLSQKSLVNCDSYCHKINTRSPQLALQRISYLSDSLIVTKRKTSPSYLTASETANTQRLNKHLRKIFKRGGEKTSEKENSTRSKFVSQVPPQRERERESCTVVSILLTSFRFDEIDSKIHNTMSQKLSGLAHV